MIRVKQGRIGGHSATFSDISNKSKELTIKKKFEWPYSPPLNSGNIKVKLAFAQENIFMTGKID